MERNEWIAKYLIGKTVKLVDLNDFFTIENKEEPIKVTKSGELEYTYKTNEYSYKVSLSPLKLCTTTFTVNNVIVLEQN